LLYEFNKNGQNKKIFLLTGIYFFFNLIISLQHEIWRDEAQAWLIARDSQNIITLFKNLQYESHPGLWYLILFPIAKIFASPLIMQVLNTLISTLTVYIIARFSIFSWAQKYLISFSYFLFYEYGIIARNYSLGIFFIFLFCSLFLYRQKKNYQLSIVLILMSFANAITLIIATILTTALIFELILNKFRLNKKTSSSFYIKNIFILSITLIIIFFIIYKTIPPSDGSGWIFENPKFDLNYIRQNIYRLQEAYLPLPEFKHEFWSTFIFKQYLINLLIVLFIIGFFTLIFINNYLITYIFIGCNLSLFLFFYLVLRHHDGLRHHGFYFIILIMTIWLYFQNNNRSTIINNFSNKILNLILILQFCSGLIAAYYEYHGTFSPSKKVAQFIESEKLYDNKTIIAAHEDYLALPVLAYLNIKKAYYFRSNSFGSFIISDKNQRNIGELNQLYIIKKSIELKKNENKSIILLLNKRLTKNLQDFYNIKEIKIFKKEIAPDEEYFIYFIKNS
jgi:hypothetical protein